MQVFETTPPLPICYFSKQGEQSFDTCSRSISPLLIPKIISHALGCILLLLLSLPPPSRWHCWGFITVCLFSFQGGTQGNRSATEDVALVRICMQALWKDLTNGIWCKTCRAALKLLDQNTLGQIHCERQFPGFHMQLLGGGSIKCYVANERLAVLM